MNITKLLIGMKTMSADCELSRNFTPGTTGRPPISTIPCLRFLADLKILRYTEFLSSALARVIIGAKPFGEALGSLGTCRKMDMLAVR